MMVDYHHSAAVQDSIPGYQPHQVEDLLPYIIDSPAFFDPPTPLDAEPYQLDLDTSIDVDNQAFDDEAPQILDGYRVQVYSDKDRGSAKYIEAKLKKDFKLGVYLVYDAPFYKVRIGDFTDRDEATQFGIEMKKRGYRDAWVIKSAVIIP